jgi:hypothetical protein
MHRYLRLVHLKFSAAQQNEIVASSIADRGLDFGRFRDHLNGFVHEMARLSAVPAFNEGLTELKSLLKDLLPSMQDSMATNAKLDAVDVKLHNTAITAYASPSVLFPPPASLISLFDQGTPLDYGTQTFSRQTMLFSQCTISRLPK